MIDAWQLTQAERKDFDYIDWVSIDSGLHSASFFRYKKMLYDIGEFSRDFGITKGTGLPDELSAWHGYMSLSAFSAMVIRYTDDNESVVVGMIYS